MTCKSNRIFQHLALIATILLALTGISWAQGTAFTYQSRLNDNGALANGNYDLQFSLFDALNGGAQVGATLNKTGIAIANGVFIVQLDFGANAFMRGGQRWLQIAVRPAGTSDPYTTLTPRTEITSTPYAIRSLSAATADNATQLNGANASQYVQTNDARLSDARDPKPGNANYIQNTTTPQAGNFNLTGNGAVGGSLSAGTVNAATQFNLNGVRFLSGSIPQENLFLGIDAGTGNTTGDNNIFIGKSAGQTNTTGSINTFIGYRAGQGNTTGRGNIIVGYRAGEESFIGDAHVAIGSLSYASGDRSTAIGSASRAIGLRATAIGRNAHAFCDNCVVLGDVADVYWHKSRLSTDQGGSIELGGTEATAGAGTPFIDFHFSGRTEDFNVRLINDASGQLSLNGKFRVTNGFNGRCLNGSIGSTSFNGSFGNACNMDLAESFRTLQRTEPGDVVTLLTQDRDKPTVRKASRAYDAHLVGVVSTNPGLVFDEGQTHLAGDNTQLITKDKTTVAMVGRVPVKFTLENGAIKVGDALTSSATEPGKAMKATSAGKIIGIALESSDKAQNGKLLMWLQIGHHEPTTTTVAGRSLNRKRQAAAMTALKRENATLQQQLSTVLGQLKTVGTRLDELERAATQTSTEPRQH